MAKRIPCPKCGTGMQGNWSSINCKTGERKRFRRCPKCKNDEPYPKRVRKTICPHCGKDIVK